LNYPSNHYLIYGNAGSRKSTFAATFPKPALVIQMDTHGKAMPYRRRGLQGEKGRMVTAVGMEDQGGVIPYEHVMHPKHKDQLLFRIEYYHTGDIQGGVHYMYAYENLLNRLGGIQKEVDAGQWQTVIFDSLSSLAYEARKLDEYKMNPAVGEGKKAHGKQVYGAAARAIEELLRSGVGGLACNLVVIGHLRDERDKEGNPTGNYVVEAPGQLPKQLPSVFPEVYIAQIDEQGETYLQTRSSQEFIATSQIPAPNPCVPNFKALWTDWEKEMTKED
jgi:hypothetical protein